MTYELTPGTVRIRATSPSPMDATAEVMQKDGTWLPLRVCSIATHLDAEKMNTATVVVEPSSIEMIATLESYAVTRSEDAPPPRESAMWRAFLHDLREAATAKFGANVTLAQAMDWLA